VPYRYPNADIPNPSENRHLKVFLHVKKAAWQKRKCEKTGAQVPRKISYMCCFLSSVVCPLTGFLCAVSMLGWMLTKLVKGLSCLEY